MNSRNHEPRYTLAATFGDRESAHAAAAELKDAGFHDAWIGVAKRPETDDSSYGAATRTEDAVEADNFFARLFGEGDETLHDALVRHGVAEADAVRAGVLGAHGAVLTVDGGNHPEAAAQILSESGGRLITSGYGATGYGTGGTHGLYDEAVEPAQRSSAADYASFRGGETIDEEKRLALREERLRIAKERRTVGEAQVGKQVVEQREEFDVPVTREEIFIERRPAGATAGSVGTIGDEREIVRIPLTEERVRVEKDTVVTEEVVVGKRTVTGSERVSATTRKEILDVEDADVPASSGTTSRGY